jgi:hypothetical protein
MPPKRFSFAEGLCEMAGLKLSAEQRLILNTEFGSDRAISKATKIPANQVPVFGAAYAKKVTGGTLTRKQWKKYLRG